MTEQELFNTPQAKAQAKDKNAYISVKEFCHLFKHDEEDFRRALRDIKPDFKIK